MAFTDPQSITISGTTTSLPRVSTGAGSSSYQSNDGLTVLKFASAYGRRTRQTARVDVTKISADPYLPAQNVKQSMSAFVVFDRPVAGFSNTEALAIYTGLATLLSSTSYAAVTKLLGGES